MASITTLNLGGTYVNGASINVYEEKVADPFADLKTFINTYKRRFLYEKDSCLRR